MAISNSHILAMRSAPASLLAGVSLPSRYSSSPGRASRGSRCRLANQVLDRHVGLAGLRESRGACGVGKRRWARATPLGIGRASGDGF